MGVFPPGPLNAITDVAGVRVGHATIVEGDSIRTGVTAVLPHGGNVFRERLPAAVHVGNGFGKLLGVTQVRELGELETPILLTCTLCVWRAADALVEWMLAQPGMEEVRSVNAVVGETNDGFLNDVRARPVRPEHVRAALKGAAAGPVEEGSVGAGSGTVAFGWKGGIGTSSRRLPPSFGGHTVGVLVQANFGGILTINGAPVGRELGRYAFQEELEVPGGADTEEPGGSIMIVVATDAPLRARNLERLASHAIVGLARTGATIANGSGDYVIAFSTWRGGVAGGPPQRGKNAPKSGDEATAPGRELSNDSMTPLFQAVAEATEEAVYNSLFRATDVTGHRGAVEALPLERVREILRRFDVLNWDRSLAPGGRFP